MAIDFNKFGKSSMGAGGAAPTAPVTPPIQEQQGAPAVPTASPAPVTSAPAPSGIDFNKFNKSSMGGMTAPVQEVKKPEGNVLAEMAKGIFGAPATILARPFQAAAAIGGASNEAIDRVTNKIPVLGGLIADAPDDFKDVKKDVGRGAQTVALGTGAPIAGGALFGAGAALEQGNDLLSVETAFQTALGGAGGKVLEIVGKPLLNAAGKVVGTITPQTLKDVASRGAQGIQQFMKENQLLGGTFAPVSEKIATGLQAVDDKIMGGVKSTVSGAGQAIKDQYPNISATEHYQKINEKDFLRPTTVNEPKYAKSKRIYDDAKERGFDLEKSATEQGIIADQLADGGKYNTTDVVDNLREGNYQASDSQLRPAIKIAEGETRRVPVSEVRAAMLRKVDSIPANQIKPEDRQWMRNQINKRYSDTSPAALEYKDGYTLTNLHDNRIISQKNGKYRAGSAPLENRPADLSRLEGRVFDSIFGDVAPKDLPFMPFKQQLEKNFLLADYLEALHGKSVPAGMTKKAVRLFGRVISATVGGKVAGYPGLILGSQAGDILFSTFEAMPNPVKMRVLQTVQKEDPKVFRELMEYLRKKGVERAATPLLPAAGGSSFKPQSPTLFGTPGGRVSPVMQEAMDIAAVETGRAKVPSTDPRRMNSRIQENLERVEPYTSPDQLPVIPLGRKSRKPKNLSDIYLE